jgi:hypothetical protein
MGSPDGALFEHEVGHFGQRWPDRQLRGVRAFELGNGDAVQQIRSFWPDMRQGNGTINAAAQAAHDAART